jgi:hypothetical protein
MDAIIFLIHVWIFNVNEQVSIDINANALAFDFNDIAVPVNRVWNKIISLGEAFLAVGNPVCISDRVGRTTIDTSSKPPGTLLASLVSQY